MRILITGARGQLGHDVAAAAANRGFDTLALPRSALDITSAGSVDRSIEADRPDLVINCAAYTAVDRAEQESQSALAVNRDGPANLAAACARASIPLIHISTDYVFDGTQDAPYSETDTVRPINAYGMSKLAGETALESKTKHFIIIRTAWVFGTQGNNFVKTMLRLGREREVLQVVNDQIGCPTFSGHLAAAILTIAERYRRQRELPWGIYHYGGQPPVSWHGFADYIFTTARALGLPLSVERLEAIPTSAYPLPAKRAANSRLDCRKIERLFGLKAPSWQIGVQTVVADWSRSHPDSTGA